MFFALCSQELPTTPASDAEGSVEGETTVTRSEAVVDPEALPAVPVGDAVGSVITRDKFRCRVCVSASYQPVPQPACLNNFFFFRTIACLP